MKVGSQDVKPMIGDLEVDRVMQGDTEVWRRDGLPLARYWRIHVQSGDAIQKSEIELSETDTGQDVSTTAFTNALRNLTSSGDVITDLLTNRQLNSLVAFATGQYVQYDLGVGNQKRLEFVRFGVNGNSGNPYRIRVSYSNDDINWTLSDILIMGLSSSGQFCANNFVPITYP